jgi:hypothetical protein
MYCPRCAKEFAPGTAYCRTCGLSLDQVAAIVSGERETEPEVKRGPNRNLMRYGIGFFILGTVIALANAMIKDLGLFPEAIGKYIFMSFVILGMLLIGIGVVFPQKRYVKKKGPAARESDQQTALATAHLDRLPSADRNIDEIASISNTREPESVTEHTTRQLI